MESHRFDSLSRSLAARLSRRSALQATGLAGAAGLVAATGLRASAQDGTATPAPPDDASFLFVQSATSGTFAANSGAGTPAADGTPVAGGGGDYLLTLEGHTGNTSTFPIGRSASLARRPPTGSWPVLASARPTHQTPRW